MRFIFSVLIILFHINTVIFDGKYKLTENISFFSRGRIGVEFFFVVSGFFLAKAAYKRQSSSSKLGKETVIFVFHKVFEILPYHLIAFAFTFISICFLEQLNFLGAIKRLFIALPNLFLIQKLGIPSNNIIGVEWYISCMLIACCILYPACRAFYDMFSRVISPVLGILLVGYMTHVFGFLSRTSDWAGLCSKVLLRAIAGMCLGIFSFEVSRYCSKLRLSHMQKTLLTFFELSGYLSVIIFSISTINLKYESYALLLLTVLVSVTMSNQTYGNAFLQRKSIFFLGRYSLSIYLCQMVALDIAEKHLSKAPITHLTVFVLGATFLLALVVYALGNRFKIVLANTIKDISPNQRETPSEA